MSRREAPQSLRQVSRDQEQGEGLVDVHVVIVGSKKHALVTQVMCVDGGEFM